jgi:hypothetical protein
MQNLYIAPTSSTPEVNFQFDRHQLSLRGESYPENAHAFFGPIMQAINAYLPTLQSTQVTVDVQLAYFNSSSTKVLLELFGLFNDAAGRQLRHPQLALHRGRRNHSGIRPGSGG